MPRRFPAVLFLGSLALALFPGSHAAAAPLVEFVWSGAVTPTSAEVRAKVIADGAEARLVVSTNPDMSAPSYSLPDTAAAALNNRVVVLPISGLTPNTQYFYMVEVGGVRDSAMPGRFRTFPVGAASFTLALSSCARTASAHAVFETIRTLNPLFFLHMGDLHYLNIAVNNRDVFRRAFDTVLASVTQSALYRDVPIAYIWDDHDFGPNNSDSLAPGREAARLTYQEYVPHYPLGAGAGNVPIYQAFTVGRARFIMTDSRSPRSPALAPDNAAKTMLGVTQKQWFKQELLAANGVYPLIVWVNSLPWIGLFGDDGWYLYSTERRELANFIKDNGITGLCMVSGDAHMLAIDDGSHSDYATGGGARFPVLQAAALDQTGSVKGGPYSGGTYPGGGQFGLMTVTDSGGPFIRVQWSGRNHLNFERVGLAFSVFAGYGPSCDCSLQGDVTGGDGVIAIDDILALIAYAFSAAAEPPIDANCPHFDRGDVNCDGVDDIIDIVSLIDFVFVSGAPPCNPCACSPYPANCP